MRTRARAQLTADVALVRLLGQHRAALSHGVCGEIGYLPRDWDLFESPRGTHEGQWVGFELHFELAKHPIRKTCPRRPGPRVAVGKLVISPENTAPLCGRAQMK